MGVSIENSHDRQLRPPDPRSTFVAGALDVIAAVGLTLYNGRDPADMLRSVASGPFPGTIGRSEAGAALGLIIHSALMGIMAAVFVAAAARLAPLRAQPVRWPCLTALPTMR